MALVQTFRDKVFKSVHGANLVYNTCWEDPRCDRALLHFEADSRILMITSAGCNALDYLLDNPAKIDCIDVNPRQNALLNLKQAALNTCTYNDFYQLFGEGSYPNFSVMLQQVFKPYLSPDSYRFWKNNSHYFAKIGLRKSFYFHGTSGLIAWFFRQHIQANPALKYLLLALFEADTISKQAEIYNKIEPLVMPNFVQWLSSRHFALSLAGVPRSQRDLIQNEYPGGIRAFIIDSLRRIFTTRSLQDNYFWYVYIFGKYSPRNAPNYLLAQNFEVLSERQSRITTHTTTISNFLKDQPKIYTHYVLLDHQDWLAHNDKAALEEEWHLILKNSARGTQILLRSAAKNLDFLPKFVLAAVDFNTDQANAQHALDRVGTYASTHLLTVK